MTLKQIKAEKDALNASWAACYGTDSDEERAIKARLDELFEIESTACAAKPQRRVRMARHCNDHGWS